MNDLPEEEVSYQPDEYRIIFDRAPICIHEIDTDGRLISMNRAGLNLVGVSSFDNLRGKAYLDFVSPKERDGIGKLLLDAFDGKASEFDFSSAGTSQPHYFHSCFIPCPDKAHKFSKLIGITYDVTERVRAEADLRTSEATAQALLDAPSDAALLLLDRGGVIVATNAFAAARLGMPVHELLGNCVFDYMPPEVSELRRQMVDRVFSDGHPVRFEDVAGSRWFDNTIYPIKDDGSLINRVAVFAMDITRHRHLEDELVAAKEEMEIRVRERTQELGKANDKLRQEMTNRKRAEESLGVLKEELERNERKRLAGILHDGVGQSLQAINLGLKMVAEDAATETAKMLQELSGEIRNAILQVRAVTEELRPMALEQMDLAEAIRLHASKLSVRGNVEISVRTDRVSYASLGEQVKEHCFFIFQEALTNAIKHSGAGHIGVHLDLIGDTCLLLEISDDGRGFSPGQGTGQSKGLGLSIIKERALRLGGSSEIWSEPGNGATVTVRMPVQ